MARVRLVVWDAAEAERRAAALRGAGHEVVAGPLDGDDLRRLRRHPPDAVVIDLSRRPGTGRDVALALRSARATRPVPLLFVEGTEAARHEIRRHLPDVFFATWRSLRGALRRALATPVGEPARPASVLAGYSGTPLPKKLGIKADASVVLVDAPDDVDETLGPLPEGVRLERGPRSRGDLVLWFVRRRSELERRLGAVSRRMGSGLWILWPKQASGVASDLTQADVRRVGLASGLVDYKVCAFDATWSGLKFARRRG